MSEHRLPVFDADGHVFEDDDELIRYYEGPNAITKRNKSLPIFPTIDGWARGVIHEREDNTPGRYSYTDCEVWATMLDTLGAEGSVLYPTAGLAYGLMQDVDFATATATAYNNWLEDRYTARDGRLFGAGLMPIENADAAAAELKRCATERTGFVAMMMPTATATPLKYGHQSYWPIYEEAVRHDMPIALHGGPSAGLGLDFQRPFAKVHAMSHPYPLFLQLTDIIWEGVFDAFPDLRIVFLEAGCSWIPFMMDRLDYEYDSIFGTEARNRLRRRPSDYIRDSDNVWVTGELGEKGMKYAVDAMGSTRIMYATDFPHEPTRDELKGAVPRFLVDPDFDDVAKANILNRNAKAFYRVGTNGKSLRRTTAEREQAITIAALKRRVVALERELATSRAADDGEATGGKGQIGGAIPVRRVPPRGESAGPGEPAAEPAAAAPVIPDTAPARPMATRLSPYMVDAKPGVSYTWCACGRSATQPFCDGSHKGTGLKPIGFTVETSQTVHLCGCRTSGNKPFCDSSHKTV